MARILLLVILTTLASILPLSACQAAATKCEYPRHAGHGSGTNARHARGAGGGVPHLRRQGLLLRLRVLRRAGHSVRRRRPALLPRLPHRGLHRLRLRQRPLPVQGCELHSTAQRYGSVAAHGRHAPCERTGFAFVNCRVTGTGRLYVGRAMGQYSRIVYAHTYFDSVIAPGGWDDWDYTSNKSMTAFFGMYRNWSPGVDAVHGVPWARELDYFAARPFLGKSFVNGYHWLMPDV